MTPLNALDLAVKEARARFSYAPDSDRDADWIQALAEDRFETPGDFETRGHGDCDDFAVWTIARAYQDAPDGDYRLVLGRVKQSGTWNGHAWVECLWNGRVWCDPTWGEPCQSPEWLGFPERRVPERGFRFDGALFQPFDYATEPSA